MREGHRKDYILERAQALMCLLYAISGCKRHAEQPNAVGQQLLECIRNETFPLFAPMASLLIVVQDVGTHLARAAKGIVRARSR